jgi:cell division protein FtsN
MKQKPNLIDISEINREIDINIFKNTSNRVNIILGLLIIFIVLLFIYFGLRKNDKNSVNLNNNDNNYNYNHNSDDNDIDYSNEDEYETPLMYRENAYDLALML